MGEETREVAVQSGERLIALALESGADVDKLEKLIELKNREEERDARLRFDEKFTLMQSEFTAAHRDRQGYGYTYAPIETLQKHYNPVITAHGFSYRWREEAIDAGGKRCVMRISGHGHSEENSFDIPPLTNNKQMNDVQAAGAMSTYGRRYTFIAGFGIIIDNEDDDAAPDTRTVKEATIDNHTGGDIEQCRRDVEALVERYEPLMMASTIQTVRLDMEAAKTYEDMRSILVDFTRAGAKIDRAEQKERQAETNAAVNKGNFGVEDTPDDTPPIPAEEGDLF